MNRFILIGVLVMTTFMTNMGGAFFWRSSSDVVREFIPASSVDHASVVLAEQAIAVITLTSVGMLNDSMLTALREYDLLANLTHDISANNVLVDAHLRDLQSASRDLQVRIGQYQVKVTQSYTLMNQCSQSKIEADRAVVQAINAGSLTSLDVLLDASIRADACEGKNRITNTAYTMLVNKYQSVYTALQRKYTYLTDNRGVIVKYPDVLSNPSIIEQLRQISQQLG